MTHTSPRGFAGLIGLLIVVAIIGFLVWRSDILAPRPQAAPAGSAGTADLLHGSTQIEQGQNAIDAANKAQQQLNDSAQVDQKAVAQ